MPDGPLAAARRATAVMGNRPVLVHVDVDVIDRGDVPLANYPHFYGGLRLDDALECLQHFVQRCTIVGVVITALNPDPDSDGPLVGRFVDRLANALGDVRKVSGPAR
jgi:arginase